MGRFLSFIIAVVIFAGGVFLGKVIGDRIGGQDGFMVQCLIAFLGGYAAGSVFVIGVME